MAQEMNAQLLKELKLMKETQVGFWIDFQIRIWMRKYKSYYIMHYENYLKNIPKHDSEKPAAPEIVDTAIQTDGI